MKKSNYADNPDYEPLYITEAGLERLKTQLTRIETSRPNLISETQRAAAFGDRSENAEYKVAKSALRRSHYRILELQDQIKRAVIIGSGPSTSGTVQLGSTVTLEANRVKKIFRVVGPHESDPARGYISHESPLGTALMNRKKGDAVIVKTGAGEKKYRVMEIH